MKIGIMGVGHIGKTLAQRLGAAGHDVKVANSRGPHTIDADVLASGARAVPAAEAVVDVDVVILSIPLNRIAQIAPLIAGVPAETVVIDTSNYYPMRDDKITAIEAGQVESLWVTEQLGRPVVKAWNAIGSDSLANKGEPAGSPGRIAIPVAADSDRERGVGWRSSRTPDSTPSTPERSRSPGVSSRVPPATAPTSPAARCRPRWRQPRRRACRSGGTWRSPRSRKGSGTPRPTLTRNTVSV